jgi:sugar lactone lactonase YvrE
MMRPEITCVLDAGVEVDEGTLWDTQGQALFWVDIPKGRLHRFGSYDRYEPALEHGRAYGRARASGGRKAPL